MRKHDCGVALYPPPEVGGFTATEDKNKKTDHNGRFCNNVVIYLTSFQNSLFSK